MGGFENFIANMGAPGSGMYLDRIDTAGHYEPGNCRWTGSLVGGMTDEFDASDQSARDCVNEMDALYREHRDGQFHQYPDGSSARGPLVDALAFNQWMLLHLQSLTGRIHDDIAAGRAAL